MLQAKSVATDLQEAIKGQHSVYFCPHQGLTFDFVNSRVVASNGKDIKLTKVQYKMLYLLVKRQIEEIAGGWCTWDELEKRLRPPYKTVPDEDGNEKKVKVKRTRDERLDRVQKAMYSLRAAIRKVDFFHPLIEYGIYKELEAYRLAAFSACAVSPGCCSLELRLV